MYNDKQTDGSKRFNLECSFIENLHKKNQLSRFPQTVSDRQTEILNCLATKNTTKANLFIIIIFNLSTNSCIMYMLCKNVHITYI